MFASLEFIYVFLPLCLLFYYLFNKNNIVLLFFSLVFYASEGWQFLFLMLGTILTAYINGLPSHSSHGSNREWMSVLEKYKNKLIGLGIAQSYLFFIISYHSFSTFSIRSLLALILRSPSYIFALGFLSFLRSSSE